MRPGKRLAKSTLREKLTAAWKHIFNVNTFLGLFILTVVAGVAVGVILNHIDSMPDKVNPTAVPNSAAHSDAVIPSNSHSANEISEEMKRILESIQKISIGNSKDWIDDKLGPPYAENCIEITENSRVWPHTDESSKVDEILECIYIFDIVSVKIYFDTSKNSCKAFFVTLMENTSGIDIIIPEAYSFCVSDKPLGKFSFVDIWSGNEPLNIYGYASNGVGRLFYGEQYYFAGSGNYQDFYFAILDYGMLNSLSEFSQFISAVQCDILPGPGLNNGASVLSASSLLVEQRGKFYPNTYGISVLNRDLTFSLFSTYTGFDSASFRKRN